MPATPRWVETEQGIFFGFLEPGTVRQNQLRVMVSLVVGLCLGGASLLIGGLFGLPAWWPVLVGVLGLNLWLGYLSLAVRHRVIRIGIGPRAITICHLLQSRSASPSIELLHSGQPTGLRTGVRSSQTLPYTAISAIEAGSNALIIRNVDGSTVHIPTPPEAPEQLERILETIRPRWERTLASLSDTEERARRAHAQLVDLGKR